MLAASSGSSMATANRRCWGLPMVRGLPDRCDHSRSRDGGVRTHAKEIWWQLARRALDAWMGVICRRSARTSRGRWQGTGGRGELPRTQPSRPVCRNCCCIGRCCSGDPRTIRPIRWEQRGSCRRRAGGHHSKVWQPGPNGVRRRGREQRPACQAGVRRFAFQIHSAWACMVLPGEHRLC